MNLKQYLFKNKIVKQDFARILGITPIYFSRILGGIRPSFKLAQKIQRETEAEVKISEFYQI